MKIPRFFHILDLLKSILDSIMIMDNYTYLIKECIEREYYDVTTRN